MFTFPSFSFSAHSRCVRGPGRPRLRGPQSRLRRLARLHTGSMGLKTMGAQPSAVRNRRSLSTRASSIARHLTALRSSSLPSTTEAIYRHTRCIQNSRDRWTSRAWPPLAPTTRTARPAMRTLLAVLSGRPFGRGPGRRASLGSGGWRQVVPIVRIGSRSVLDRHLVVVSPRVEISQASL